MTILHIVGKPRKGKGVLMSKLGLWAADHGTPVDTNYHLSSPNARFIDFYQMLSFLKLPRQNPPHLLLIDELPGWCDSYVSQSKSSRFATHFLNQSAKLGYDLIFTSQRSMRADINFRELSDARLKAEKIEEKKKFVYGVMDPEIIDEDVWTGKTLELPFSDAATFWHRFDTWEALPPIGLDEVLTEVEKHDFVRKNVTVERQSRMLLENIELLGSPPRLDRSSVMNALLLLGESDIFAALVGARLRLLMQQKEIPQRQTSTFQFDQESGFQLIRTQA